MPDHVCARMFLITCPHLWQRQKGEQYRTVPGNPVSCRLWPSEDGNDTILRNRVNIYNTAGRHNPEDQNQQFHCHEDVKSHIILIMTLWMLPPQKCILRASLGG
jgi:hypothetical protein